MFDLPPEFWVAALVVCTAVTAVAVVARRHLVGRLHAVAAEAEDIATSQLPAVLDALRTPTPGALLGALPQVTAEGDDDISTIAHAFNTVLQSSVEVSIDHARRHAEVLTNLLVSLGRRNQTLIDRQLELVDRLEATHDDPDTLEGLFALDHMLTTMRRNAENLLVLASDGSPRRWTQPVAMCDVIRGAVSEVGEMSRVVIEVAPDDDAVVVGRAAVDLSHLVAELVDNATTYSPPSANVVVRGEVRPHGYRIWVLDQGFGMPEDTLESVNVTLADGGRMEELVADQVGFQVIGRLAQRLGSLVRLQPNPGGGLAASVAIPASNLERLDTADAPTARLADVLPAAPRPISMVEAAAAAQSPSLTAPVAPFVVAPPAPAAVEPPAMPLAPVGMTEGMPAAFMVPGPPVAPDFGPGGYEAIAMPVDVPAEMPHSARRVFYRVEIMGSPDGSEPIDAPGAAPAESTSAAVATTIAAATAPLTKRMPGAVFAGTEHAASRVDAGSLRRLPVPAVTGATGARAEDEASDRGARLHELVDGVARGRLPLEPVDEEVSR